MVVQGEHQSQTLKIAQPLLALGCNSAGWKTRACSCNYLPLRIPHRSDPSLSGLMLPHRHLLPTLRSSQEVLLQMATEKADSNDAEARCVQDGHYSVVCGGAVSHPWVWAPFHWFLGSSSLWVRVAMRLHFLVVMHRSSLTDHPCNIFGMETSPRAPMSEWSPSWTRKTPWWTIERAQAGTAYAPCSVARHGGFIRNQAYKYASIRFHRMHFYLFIVATTDEMASQRW